MRTKSILAALLLLLAGVQTMRAQKMTVNLANGKTVVYRISQVESVVFDEGIASPEYVDLGLPSGTLWATFNVGAASPEEYGDYFAWGETEPKAEYSWSTYKWCIDYDYNEFSKYSYTDGKIVLDPEDDAATVNWGSEWKMPSYGQLGELVDESYTTIEKTTQNGIKGYKVTSKTNGKSIFMPATGFMEDEEVYSVGEEAFYWSSTLNTGGGYIEYGIAVNVGNDVTLVSRAYGASVRPVSSAKTNPILVKSIELNMTSLILKVNKTATLYAEVSPYYADNQEVVWESSNENIAQVSSNGKVTAIAAGSCTIICRAADGGGAKDECQVTVVDTDTKEYVDLGLPSGTLWATCNVGAVSPEEYGDYFAWGETTPKEVYFESTYKWLNGDDFTKYNDTDGKKELDPEDDAATVNWGSEWKMPNKAQCEELLDENYTTIEKTTLNGHTVFKVTSKTNGNSIFLPVAGHMEGRVDYDDGHVAECWSSTLVDKDHSYYIYCSRMGTDLRYLGLSVRPVRVQEDPHESVDLGLPSGTLWATCNVGANSPEEYGDYFAWGETEPKGDYSWSSYKWMTEGQANWQYINKYTFADNQKTGCWYDGDNFIGDGQKVLLPADDAATANWGSDWQMPSSEQCEELMSEANTTTTWTTQNGVTGLKITSKTNHNSIFLPAGGSMNGSNLMNDGVNGQYWSRSLYTTYSDYGFNMLASSSGLGMAGLGRYYGYCVRPVRK